MDNLFSVYLHHGGNFLVLEGDLFYVGGDTTIICDLDADRIGYFDLVDIVENLGYNLKRMCYKHPDLEINKALIDVEDDKQVLDMVALLPKTRSRMIMVCVEGTKLQQGTDEVGGRSGLADEDESSNDEDIDNEEAGEVEKQVEESDTDDGLEDNELSDDQEYVEARKCKAQYKNQKVAPTKSIVQKSNSLAPTKSIIQKKSVEQGKAQGNDEDAHSDYEVSDGDVDSLCTSEEEDMGCSSIRDRRNRRRRVVYDPSCGHQTVELTLGMRFEDAHQCKTVVKRMAIINGRNIQIMRCNKHQLQVRCVEGCPFKLYGSMIKSEGIFTIKTLVNDHSCAREMRNRQVTSQWLAEEYMNRFKLNPNFTAKDLALDAMTTYVVEVCPAKSFRAKAKAMQMLRGSVTQYYALLRSYASELMRVDREGRFEFLLDDDGHLQGFFIGSSAVKHGFLSGCMPIIGFDGCFLKTFLGGALLTAIGKDGNNQMFPLFWAVVAAENEFYWSWFVKILMEELQLVDGLGWTFISDQQKGLTAAISRMDSVGSVVTRSSTEKRILAKERRMASSGSGVLVCEGSGNIYLNSRVGSRNVMFVSGPEAVTTAMRGGRGGRRGRGGRGGRGATRDPVGDTQESTVN